MTDYNTFAEASTQSVALLSSVPANVWSDAQYDAQRAHLMETIILPLLWDAAVRAAIDAINSRQPQTVTRRSAGYTYGLSTAVVTVRDLTVGGWDGQRRVRIADVPETATQQMIHDIQAVPASTFVARSPRSASAWCPGIEEAARVTVAAAAANIWNAAVTAAADKIFDNADLILLSGYVFGGERASGRSRRADKKLFMQATNAAVEVVQCLADKAGQSSPSLSI
jgi:hypothetical protein